ncbi:MAG TPA: helix-turn-helix domain-containing protein [Rubrobacteraceae bacterium]|nr:helix-turn-helix domain-containing protein [Rubrobacteraceae bacterium]
MRTDYPTLIRESEEELLSLEKQHRHSHLDHRLRMLRLLKMGRCSSIQQAAGVLGYSWRQCQRWITTYRRSGLNVLLMDNTHKRGGSHERVTPEAWRALEEVMERGEIATYAQAQAFLAERGIDYRDVSSIFRLFKRHRVKAKTGRPRNRKADKEEQERFKKTSPASS